MAKSLAEINAEWKAKKAKEKAEQEARENAPKEIPTQTPQTTVAGVNGQAAIPPRKGFLSRVAKPAVSDAVAEIPGQSAPQQVPQRVEQSTSVAPVPTTVQSGASVGVPPPKTDLKDADISSLRRNLDYLAEHIEHKELVGQVVRNIAAQLQENPQFSSQMQPHDFNLIVRGLRKAFNTAARKKSEGVAKKKASDDETNEILEMLKGAGIGLG